MKKTAKVVLILIVILVVLFVAGVFALNQYIQSPSFKDYLLAKTQEQLAVPMQVQELKASIFSGFELRGLVVKNPQGSQTPSLLETKALVFHYRLLPLLHKKVEIETITVDSPTIVLEKADDGTWNYEKLTRGEPQTTNSTSTGATPAPTKTAPTKAPPSGLDVEIANFALSHANVTMLKPEGKKLLQVTDCNVHSRVEGNGPSLTGQGDLKITDVSVVDSLDVKDIQSPITIEQQQLKLTNLTARIEGGTLQSSMLVDLQKEGYPFTLHVGLAGVDVGRLGSKFSDKAKYLTGTLKLTTDLSGVGGDTQQLKGKGDTHIENGTLTGVPLLQTIGGLLGIPALQRIQFDEITIEYSMDNGVIDTPVIKLLSKDIQLTGSGKTDFDFNLDHQFTLALSPAIMSQVPTQIAGVFNKRADGFRTIDFNVTGPCSHPKTDLAQKLVKAAAGSWLQQNMGDLLGGKKKKKEQ